jgi:chlorite dismutase
MANHKIISFVGSDQGAWDIAAIERISGNPINMASRLSILKQNVSPGEFGNVGWIFKAVISNIRYTTRSEKTELDRDGRGLNQPEFDCAVMIPIKKSDTWWAMTQDERRKVFEEDSRHIAMSMPYLPFISRQLHHSRDLGEEFDFITWFEFSSVHVHAFDKLCSTLRRSKEWEFVTRESEVRLRRIVV